MNESAVSTPATNGGLRLLRRRQWAQIVSRSEIDYEGVLHLAAVSYMRAADKLPLQDHLAPVSSVLMVVLSYHRQPPDDGGPYVPFLRTIRPRVDPSNAKVVWDAATSGWGFDLSRRLSAEPDGTALTYAHAPLARLALAMDRKCRRLMFKRMPARHPSLPPLLLGFAPGERIMPQMTPHVMEVAAAARKPWRDVWHQLERETRVSDRLNHTGLRLIDSRLYPHIRPTTTTGGCLGEFLDLRRVMGRGVLNPLSKNERAVLMPHQRRLEMLIDELPPEFVAAADATDLDAACRPKSARRHEGLPASLHLARAATIQVWTPPHYATRPESFVFEAHGHEVDMWNVDPRWNPIAKAAAPAPKPRELELAMS